MARTHEQREALRRVPEGLWRRLRADPVRAPEHIALAAAEWHGPAAAAWLASRRALYAYDGRELAHMAKRKHASLARFGGAATGLGGVVTSIADVLTLAWIQSRLVFFVAAAFDFDPNDPMRPAELLVLQGIYEDVGAARQALDGAGATMIETLATGSAKDRELLGSLMRYVGRYATRRAVRLVPLLASPYNAISNERETRRLADRAIAFYGGLPAAPV